MKLASRRHFVTNEVNYYGVMETTIERHFNKFIFHIIFRKCLNVDKTVIKLIKDNPKTIDRVDHTVVVDEMLNYGKVEKIKDELLKQIKA